jgi:hypothetical protein
VLSLGAVGLAGIALADTSGGTSTPAPAPSAGDAQAIVQQIHDQAYSRCTTAGKMGAPGTELQSNCSCAADVAVMLLSDDAKQAMADGSFATFKGAMLKGEEMFRDTALIKSCPKLAAYMHDQYCSSGSSNPHCEVLEKAMQQAQ